MREAAEIASRCRHYAMCKIDFLGTGICAAGTANHYVSYYPQGRMDIYHALANNLIPVTKRLVEIAETCNLCGICDKQCHFVTELRPMKVMKALKDYVEAYIAGNNKIIEIEDNDILKQFKKIVGERNATNDPAILVTYSHDPSPGCELKMPGYVVMPAMKEEVTKILIVCNQNHLPFVVRGNGSSVIGLVMSEGVIIDTNRMKSIAIDKDNWRVDVGAGVTAFDLQKEVQSHGYRVCSAEPSALVCGNIMCSGILSTFSHAYGAGADNFINAELINSQGECFHLNDKKAPNLFAFEKNGSLFQAICTNASLRLYPTTDDEEAILIPFSGFQEAIELCRQLSIRRIGLSVALLGTEYSAAFIAPTVSLADKVKILFKDKLGIQFLVLVIGDKYAIDTIKKMVSSRINQKLYRLLLLGFPQLVKDEVMDLLNDFKKLGFDNPYEMLCKEEMYPLLEVIMNPSPETLASAVPEDLRDFYVNLYSRPEMTDLVWLNTFRILSTRMGRYKHFVPFIGYVPLDKIDVIMKMIAEFKRIGDKYELRNDYGFLTPVDFGKRAILEYDYYIDQTDPSEISQARKAIEETIAMIDNVSSQVKGIQWIHTILSQGCARKENFLYS